MKQLKYFQIKWTKKPFKRFIKNYLTLNTQEQEIVIVLNKDLICLLKTRIRLCLYTNS